MLKAIKGLEGYSPRLTVVACIKGHHVRFFNEAGTDEQPNRTINIEAGTIVDSDVTSTRSADMYMAAHAAILGTTRPTRYEVLVDENNLSYVIVLPWSAHGDHSFLTFYSRPPARTSSRPRCTPSVTRTNAATSRSPCRLRSSTSASPFVPSARFADCSAPPPAATPTSSLVRSASGFSAVWPLARRRPAARACRPLLPACRTSTARSRS